MKIKSIYVLLDEEGDIVETFSENRVVDELFQVQRVMCPSGSLHRAILHISNESIEQMTTGLSPDRLLKIAPTKPPEQTEPPSCVYCFWCDTVVTSYRNKHYNCEHPKMDGKKIGTTKETPSWCPRVNDKDD